MKSRGQVASVSRRWAVAALILAIVCIGVLTLTPGGRDLPAVQGASWWTTVTCLTCSRAWLADIISNVVLFVPLGAALAAAGVPARRAVLLGAAASLLIELLQLSGVAPGRTPAIADIVSNTIGTGAGLLCSRFAPSLVRPTGPLAHALRNGWAVLCAATWILLACAMQPATPVQSRAEVSASQLPFTPGYGWFAAEAVRTEVDGVPVAHHRGSGPVLVAARRTDSTTARVLVRGRDRRTGVVPVVFVHEPTMTRTDPVITRAHLLLAQHHEDASLASDLRAAHWGLRMPELRVAGAFGSGPDSVQLEATITTHAWHLLWYAPSEPGVRHAATLQLSPAIGWMLVQSIVPVRALLGEVLTAAWLFICVAPLGYWSCSTLRVRSASRSVQLKQCLEAALWAGALLGVGWAAAAVTRTSPVSLAQGSWCVLSAVVGAGLRALVAPAALPGVATFESARSD